VPYYDYEEPAPGRSIWPWLLALGLIVAGGVGGWFLYTTIQSQLNRNRPVVVPDETLIAKPLAVQHIRAAGFLPKLVYANSPTVAKGSVISEDPGPGAKIVKGSTVTLTISTGRAKSIVPEVRGQKLSDALQLIYAAGLQPKIAYVYSAQPTDVVVGEAPAPKTQVLKGSDVHINVSKGLKPVPVPNVIDQPFLNAKSALAGQGFVVARTDIQSDKPKGVVVAEDPPQGTPVGKGTKITLSISKGPATAQVPDVRGQNVTDATALLKGAGFQVAVIYQPVNDPGSDGIVVAQDPIAGTNSNSKAVVTITVGQLSSGTPTTTTTATTPTTTP
jgi:serine/threonine-protein kinase